MHTDQIEEQPTEYTKHTEAGRLVNLQEHAEDAKSKGGLDGRIHNSASSATSCKKSLSVIISVLRGQNLWCITSVYSVRSVGNSGRGSEAQSYPSGGH